MKKISFYTFGCRLNQSETASIQNSFKHSDYKVVGFDDPSDIVVINTCTVTESADSSSRHQIRQLARENPNSKLVVTGCFAERQPDVIKNLEGVVQDRFHYSGLPTGVLDIISYAWPTTITLLSHQCRSKADCKVSWCHSVLLRML